MEFSVERLQARTTEFLFLDREVTISGYQGDYVFETINSTHRFYEDDLLNFLAHIDFNGSDIIDVGANLGNHTVNLALVNENSTVVSIEPFEENIKLLNSNVEKNGISDQVTIVKSAAGDSVESLQISHIDASNLGAIKVEPTSLVENQLTVRQIRLDDLSKHRDVGLIKIDVEGFEANVLRGARELIGKHRPVIVTEAHSPVAYRTLARLLSDYDYVPLAIRGKSDNYIWASVGKTLPKNRFEQVSNLAEVLDRRESRVQLLKRINRLEASINGSS